MGQLSSLCKSIDNNNFVRHRSYRGSGVARRGPETHGKHRRTVNYNPSRLTMADNVLHRFVCLAVTAYNTGDVALLRQIEGILRAAGYTLVLSRWLHDIP